MDIVREAFNSIFPERPYDYSATVTYSGRFSGYNARIGLDRAAKKIVLRLSRKWQGVARDIQLGLVQHLLARLFRERRRTVNMDLYFHFMKAVPKTVARTRSNPVLEQSFLRVNSRMFGSLLDQPNLVIGNGVSKLGHYDIGADKISISKSLLSHPELMDYVMYHELLHRKLGFSGTGLRSTHHGKAFRQEEIKFPRAKELDNRLGRFVRRRRFFGWF